MRHKCGTSAAQVRHKCGTSAAQVRHKCGTSAAASAEQVRSTVRIACGTPADVRRGVFWQKHPPKNTKTPPKAQKHQKRRKKHPIFFRLPGCLQVPVRIRCGTAAAPVRHRCGTGAAPVRHRCGTGADRVRTAGGPPADRRRTAGGTPADLRRGVVCLECRGRGCRTARGGYGRASGSDCGHGRSAEAATSGGRVLPACNATQNRRSRHCRQTAERRPAADPGNPV